MVSASASASVPPVAAITGVSKTKPTTLRLSVGGIAGAPLDSLAVVYGKAASAPATFAGLANPTTNVAIDGDAASYSYPPGGSTVNITYLDLNMIANAAWSPGDLVWVCVFDSATPSGADVPVATAGPVTVVA